MLLAAENKEDCWEGTKALIEMFMEAGYQVSRKRAQICKGVTKISLSANTREDGDVTTGWGAPKRLGWEASRTARGGGNCSFLPDSVFPYHTAPAAPPGAGLNVHHPGCSVRLWPPPALILVDPRVHISCRYEGGPHSQALVSGLPPAETSQQVDLPAHPPISSVSVWV